MIVQRISHARVRLAMEFPSQNETKVIGCLADNGPLSIRDLAKLCGWIKSLGTAKADSRVRNALRRIKRDGYGVKKARGLYELNAKGRTLSASTKTGKKADTSNTPALVAGVAS